MIVRRHVCGGIDHFRRLDDDVLIGLMDLRGQEPLFFTLRREVGPPEGPA